MPLAVAVLLALVGFPALVIGAVWLRLKAKERLRDVYLAAVRKDLLAAGAEPLEGGVFRWNGRAGKIEASTNPLFGRGFSVRLAAWSDTIHEFELRRGRPVPPEFAGFRPLLARWDTAGKIHADCYAAGITENPLVSQDVKSLLELSSVPLSRSWEGGTFTYREGFEPKVPQWHWRHDLRPKLPQNVHRYCFSYWQEGPLLNPVVMNVLWDLAGGARKFFVTDLTDLRFLEYGFGPGTLTFRGTLVELGKPDMAVAADLRSDGEFFGGLLAAREAPPGFEAELPRYRFHEEALRAFPACDFYARRLYDDECSWFSGEYEIVSTVPLDVRGTLLRIAAGVKGQVMDIDRRFHKRIVVPLNY